jgi:hypothetical protein
VVRLFKKVGTAFGRLDILKDALNKVVFPSRFETATTFRDISGRPQGKYWCCLQHE